MANGIDAQTIKGRLTNEDIIKILKELGSETYIIDRSGNLIFKTVCHGGDSYKLYYYSESKNFHCFTHCSENYDIFGLVMQSLNYTFQDAIFFVMKVCNIKSTIEGFSSKDKLTDDWSLLQKYNILSQKEETKKEDKILYNESILDYFDPYLYKGWEDEGITYQAAMKFGIRYDGGNNRIIIPHRDIEGDLIGIRVRNLNDYEVDNGRKYMPLALQTIWYNHSTGANLYGLYENLQYIKQCGKIMLFESEKSVLQAESFYPNHNFTVATCGSAITLAQRRLILSLGIKEVFIAFDKEFNVPFSEESNPYAEKLIKLGQSFAPYFQTYVLWDAEGLLSYKDSPSDKGKKTLEKLMKNKYEITSSEE